MTSLMVALYVITERYQRYSFRGSVLVVLAFARFVNAQNAHVLHMFVEPNHQTTGRRKIRKKKVPVIHTFIMDNPEYLDNSVEVNLQDVITGEEFTLQLSPNSALKAKTGKRKATDQPAIIQTLIEKRQKAEEEKARDTKKGWKWKQNVGKTG
ncbi:uncharacterized protein [Temnothorax longispinosus]|uniref:uncharacterized protein n=1 Tax=Temnothorax longispinosus TaxID=300112 RepID=UPI003A99CD84